MMRMKKWMKPSNIKRQKNNKADKRWEKKRRKNRTNN